MSNFILQPAKQRNWLFIALLALVQLLLPAALKAQEPVFNDATLATDEVGHDGAVYKFPYVIDDVDSLPVVVSSFNARKKGNQVLLSWSTDMEKKRKSFCGGEKFRWEGIQRCRHCVYRWQQQCE